jgi:outer membrane immunogenic protein
MEIGTWSKFKAGWTAGAGAEAAISPNWSVKFEYLYMDLGNVGGSTVTNATATAVIGGGRITTNLLNYTFNTRFTDNIVRVGLNYRFSAPIVAKY